MRLLSFLTEIERSLAAGWAGTEGPTWESSRMLNFHYGMARLTLTPRGKPERPGAGGNIFLQAFSLADGSLCLKASLGWDGSDEVPVIAIYSTPTLSWKQEAARISAAWLKGPSSRGISSVREDLTPLAASAG